jgi:hypothetical protein
MNAPDGMPPRMIRADEISEAFVSGMTGESGREPSASEREDLRRRIDEAVEAGVLPTVVDEAGIRWATIAAATALLVALLEEDGA